MESDSFALRTALFSLLGLILLGVSWNVLKDKHREYKQFLVRTEESISGIALESRVYYKGVEVGAVKDIYFSDGDFNNVNILINVEKSIPIATNTYAQLALRGVTGEYDLRLENDGALGAPLTASENTPAVIKMKPAALSAMLDSVENALDEVQTISSCVANLLDSENLETISQVLEGVNIAVKQFSQLETELSVAAVKLPTAIDQFVLATASYQQLADKLTVESKSLGPSMVEVRNASQNLSELVAHFHTRTLRTTEETLQSIDQSSIALNRFVDDLRQDPQRLLLGYPIELGPGETIRSQE